MILYLKRPDIIVKLLSGDTGWIWNLESLSDSFQSGLAMEAGLFDDEDDEFEKSLVKKTRLPLSRKWRELRFFSRSIITILVFSSGHSWSHLVTYGCIFCWDVCLESKCKILVTRSGFILFIYLLIFNTTLIIAAIRKHLEGFFSA